MNLLREQDLRNHVVFITDPIKIKAWKYSKEFHNAGWLSPEISQ
jgi:hypothetical protein